MANPKGFNQYKGAGGKKATPSSGTFLKGTKSATSSNQAAKVRTSTGPAIKPLRPKAGSAAAKPGGKANRRY